MALGKILSLHDTGRAGKKAPAMTLAPLTIVKNAAAFVAALLLGCSGGAFSCYPFGTALLTASGRHTAVIWLGLMVSALFCRGNAAALAVTYTAGFMLRAALSAAFGTARPEENTGSGRAQRNELSRPEDSKPSAKKPRSLAERLMTGLISGGSGNVKLFSEAVLLRCAVSALTAFAFGMYRLISGGFLYYDLFGMLTGTLLCPALTLALSTLTADAEKYRDKKRIGILTLGLMLIFSLRDYSVFGFSPAYIAAFIAALWAASVGGLDGALRGCAAGLAAGLAAGCDPTLISAAGFAVGLLWKVSKAAAAAAAAIIPLMLGLTTDGFETLRTVLPDTLGAVTVFMPLSYYGLLPKLPTFAQPDPASDDSEAVILEKKQADTVLRMNSLSGALGRLSDIIYTLSDRLRRPGIIDLKQICDNAFDDHCSRCSLSSLCLERECTSTLDARAKITTGLYKTGKVDAETIPGWLRERCYNLDHIISDIDRGTAELVEGLIRNDKTEAFAIDYESLSKLLAESIAENDAEYRVDTELTAKLRRSLKYMDMPRSQVLCWGARRKQVYISGVELAGLRLGADEIRRMTENILRTRLTRPSFNIEGEKVEISMSSARRYSVESAKATSVRESESANGDTAITFETREDYFYSLISDGMGSGREAAVTSKLCGVFAEQLLTGGNQKAITLEMLHGFLRNRPGECSATVDLAEIDLLNGKAAFVKSGAAPSFVLRGGNLYKLQSKTVPIGIMPALDAEQIKFDLESGDIIIMLSDGVAQSLEDGVWLANMLTYEWIDDLQLMAEKILDGAALNNPRSDDMTAVLLKVSEAPESGVTTE